MDGAEEREDAAAAVNTQGGQRRRRRGRGGRRVVLPSTDYGFDGARARLHRGRRRRPRRGLRRTKLAGERAALAACRGARVARTAWLYGAPAELVNTMRRLGAERDEVSVVDDQEGCPTWTRDLAPALEALLEQPPGVYHTAGAGSVTWAGFARATSRSRVDAGCARSPRPSSAPRPSPGDSPLAVTRPGAPRLRPWRDALRDYLEEAA